MKERTLKKKKRKKELLSSKFGVEEPRSVKSAKKLIFVQAGPKMDSGILIICFK